MSEQNANNQTQTEGQQAQQSENQSQPVFDYDKLANLISGKQSVTEDTILKSYFKQQGMSADEMSQAISAFKAEKAKNQPDVNALQAQTQQYQQSYLKALTEKQATLEAVKLGIAPTVIPYVLKLADFSAVVNTDGKVNDEKLKEALTKVLEDIPQFKAEANTKNTGGFEKIGSEGNDKNNVTEDTLRGIFGIKK